MAEEKDAYDEYSRTLEIALYEARAAKEEADKANKAKGQFLAQMSHEIRTPINAILGMDTMILRECRDERINRYALDIQSAGRNLLSIINDILDFSKIESGKMSLIYGEYDFASLVNDVVNMVRPRAMDKDLALEVIVDPTLPGRFIGDDVRLRQILVNLMSNAVKYTPSGKVTLSVERDSETEDGDLYIAFSVKDTGTGIRPEDIDKLTEEFVRIEEERNHNIEGTGLGISISVSLLKLMHSHLCVDSVYGEGSNFHFLLKQVVTCAEPIGDINERMKQANVSKEYMASFCIPDATLLVVDDNEMNRHVFSNLLKDMQCRIDEAESGAQCLERIHETKYDIIFMDYMMPYMDGVETLKRMKQLGDYLNADTPVVILTANAVNGAKDWYLAAGFDDYLSKPIDADSLERMIGKLIADDRKKPVIKKEENKSIQELIADMPLIDGVDWNVALLKLKKEKLLMESVRNLQTVADLELEQLNRLGEHLTEDNGYDAYRIKAHSMKTSAATIGATHVAGLAKYLEYAARDRDTNLIYHLSPLFAREWKRLKAALDEQFPVVEQVGAESIETERLKERLETLQKAVDEVDPDGADAVMEELRQYAFSQAVDREIKCLAGYVLKLDAAGCNETIKRILSNI